MPGSKKVVAGSKSSITDVAEAAVREEEEETLREDQVENTAGDIVPEDEQESDEEAQKELNRSSPSLSAVGPTPQGIEEGDGPRRHSQKVGFGGLTL